MIDPDAFDATVRRAQAELRTDLADAEVAASRLRTDIGETWASAAGRVFPAEAGAAFTALDEALGALHTATTAVLADLRLLDAKAAALTPVAAAHLAARAAGAAGYVQRHHNDDDVKVRAAQDRQAAITAAQHAGDLAAELDDLAVNAPDEMRVRAEARARTNPDLAPMVEPMLTGDRWRTAREHGAAPIGKIGDREPFDPHRHHVLGPRPNPGEPVEILRPGVAYAHEPDTVIRKAVVVQPE